MTCLDEETVLAFCAGGLPAAARLAAEEHLASCDECRVLVSAVARSSFAVAPSALAKRPTAATPLLGSPPSADTAGALAVHGTMIDPSSPVGRMLERRLVDPAMAPTTPVGPSARPGPITSPVQPGDVLAGRFVVERVLGAGGMGVVVAARHTQLDQRVALKFLLPVACEVPGAVNRFLREGRAAARITSEHVARVVDTGVLDTGAPYLVMEYLEGADLGAVLARRGRVSWPEAIEYVLQACEAIAEAHELGIIHRDLKPANLFLAKRADGSPLVKVLDFGISKLEGGGSRSQLTSTSMLMGSPRYMSPEQMLSARDVDARTDVWALGVLLYELVTGKPVWSADTVQGLCALIASAPTPPLRALAPDAPALLEEVVSGCLAKTVDARIASVADLARALAPIAPSSAHTSIERIQRVAARSGKGGGDQRPSNRPPAYVPSAPPPASFPPPRPPSEVTTGPRAGGASTSGGRAALALGALVGVLLVVGIAANALLSRRESTSTGALPTAAAASAVAMPASSSASPPAASPGSPPAASLPTWTGTITSAPPPSVSSKPPEPPRGAPPPPARRVVAAAPAPPGVAAPLASPSPSPSPAPPSASTPASVDTSRALVDRK